MSRRGQVSAGLLAFRRAKNGPEILLVHPGGPYWARKDAASWSIPKGLVESEDLLACARREFTEETGLVPEGPFEPLAPVRQTNGKIVHAFSFEADLDLSGFVSNHFEMEWPPRSGHRQSFPEADRIAYFDLQTARQKIHRYQRPLIEELVRKLQA
ncbi:MAG TPA: NUDIX domain-containing protein [Dongiaceae bacterium]|nr:NUDIX domain-containing protein [Dongiaceae bacterium]